MFARCCIVETMIWDDRKKGKKKRKEKWYKFWIVVVVIWASNESFIAMADDIKPG